MQTCHISTSKFPVDVELGTVLFFSARKTKTVWCEKLNHCHLDGFTTAFLNISTHPAEQEGNINFTPSLPSVILIAMTNLLNLGELENI